MIRAAIVGIGWWGRMLVNAVQGKSAAIRFTAGYTRTRATAEGFCAEHSIVLANELDALLADPAVDAVVFATPHSQHGPQVERAAAAGKPVFIEKPFTLDVASAERALNAAARAGIVLAVAYPRRFHPSVAELKVRIADGRLGVLSHCQSEQTAPAGLSMRADYWRSRPGGGASRGDDRDRRAQCRSFDPPVPADRRGLLLEPSPRHGAARRHDRCAVRSRQRHVGHSLLLARDRGQHPLRLVRYQGLRRTLGPGAPVPLLANARGAPHWAPRRGDP